MSEPLYTVREVATILRVREETIRAWLRKGKMTGIKLPDGDYRIKESTVNGILGQQTA
jgi:excisionase family DNA binding protein